MNKGIIYNYIVVGGGASGLFFATNIDASGAPTEWREMPKGVSNAPSLILEKTERPGIKLLMSGGGRCNITHEGSIKDFVPRYGENGKRIRRILYRHNNLELIDWLSKNGIDTISEDDGRVFPASQRASDVLDLLLKKARENGFEIKTNSAVTAIKRNGELWRVHTDNAYYDGRRIIIATGGCSYPKTGSDGSMFNVLRRDLNLEITELSPALSPISVRDYPYADLSGISIDGAVSTYTNQKKKSIGKILFTHNGLSGPAIINISGSISTGDIILINYLYPMDYDAAFRKLQAATLGSKAQLANIASEVFGLPKNLCRTLGNRAGTSTKAFAKLLTEDMFTVENPGSFDMAMVTRGGVSLDEVDLSTLESLKCPGIFIIGEALDVDGETGGYNLQFAYSSALCAALAYSQA